MRLKTGPQTLTTGPQKLVPNDHPEQKSKVSRPEKSKKPSKDTQKAKGGSDTSKAAPKAPETPKGTKKAKEDTPQKSSEESVPAEETSDQGWDLETVLELASKSKGDDLRDYMVEKGLIEEDSTITSARDKAEELLDSHADNADD